MWAIKADYVGEKMKVSLDISVLARRLRCRLSPRKRHYTFLQKLNENINPSGKEEVRKEIKSPSELKVKHV